ncbi:hypothetical protein VE01_00091 [Pseudogymnoascus verrucosus]|uniref:Uncharacterized protein n=1 Tax=Pseudogymnoascus verrucosus TaxID=342668 RepID=A0A2P2SXH8_9PEZI|nr:uncharacterized protein VE01_00091 [Pseudogymnoascus verrucosus]OBU01562.1 hypothetical protein VE01_00091 [Pseudogymnoascus verrucosus]
MAPTSGWANSNLLSSHHSQQPTFTHIAEPAHPGPRLRVEIIDMCQKITTTYQCGCTAVTWVKTSGCSGDGEKCDRKKSVSFKNDDTCDKHGENGERSKTKLR